MKRKKILLLLALLCAVVQGAPIKGLKVLTDGSFGIESPDDWEMFCLGVNGTESYSGKTVKLIADITVSTMAGTSEGNSFKGTFDGNGHTLKFNLGTAGSAYNEDYCAPFRYVNGATIKNLKVAGDIYTSRKFAAGLVARPYGTTTITGCHVSTVIHSSVNGDGIHGGIVAIPYGTTNISGCVYAGRLFTSNGTNSCGGLVGWHNGQTLNFTNSIYAPNPSITAAANEGTFTDGCATIVRGIEVVEGCYYTETMGDVQGYQVYTNASADGIYKRVTGDGYNNYYAVCNISGVDESYKKTGSAISVTPIVTCSGTTLTAGVDYTCTFSPATVQEAGDYTLTITGKGSCLGTKTYQFKVLAPLSGNGTSDSPYIVSSTEDWDAFANAVNDGNAFTGNFVKLTADITVSTMVVASDGNSFQGTFDGDGKTLTFNRGTAESAFNEEYCAPFRYVNGATIQNLKVAGDIYTSRKFAAGLVARPYGTTNISNCYVSTVIHSSVNGDGTHGGIVAIPYGTTNISGCVYAGRLFTSNGTINCGGLVGWHNGKTLNITNSIYAPDTSIKPAANEVAITEECATIVRGGNAGTNCYYTETMGDVQGYQVYTNVPADGIYKQVTVADGKTYYAVCNIAV